MRNTDISCCKLFQFTNAFFTLNKPACILHETLLKFDIFLVSVFGSNDFLTDNFWESFKDFPSTETPEEWSVVTNEQANPIGGIQRTRPDPFPSKLLRA